MDSTSSAVRRPPSNFGGDCFNAVSADRRPAKRYVKHKDHHLMRRMVTNSKQAMIGKTALIEQHRNEEKSEVISRANLTRKHRMDDQSIRYFLRIMRSTRLSGQDIEDAINNITLPDGSSSHTAPPSDDELLMSEGTPTTQKVKATSSPSMTSLANHTMSRKNRENSLCSASQKNREQAEKNSSTLYLQQFNSPWLSLNGKNINLRHQSHVRKALKSSRVVQSAPPGVELASKQDLLSSARQAHGSITPRMHTTRVLGLPHSTAILGYYGDATAPPATKPTAPARKTIVEIMREQRVNGGGGASKKAMRSIVVKLPSSLDDRHAHT